MSNKPTYEEFEHQVRELEKEVVQLKQSVSEKALLESEIKYRNLAESLSELVYRADPKTFKATYVNKSVDKFYGYTVDEWLKDSSLWEDLIHPDDKERVFAGFAEARTKIESRVIEYRILKQDNTILWVEDRVSWEKDHKGKVISMNGLLYDVTNRKRLEENLQKAYNELEKRVKARTAELVKINKKLNNEIEERMQAEEELKKNREFIKKQFEELKQIYNTSPVGLCLVDTDLNFIRINEMMAEINGKPLNFHIGKNIKEVIPGIASQIIPIYMEVIESGKPQLNFEVHGTTPAEPNKEKDWLVSYYPLTAGDRTVYAVSAVVQDISLKKQLESSLLQSQKLEAISTLAGGIAHDFNNMLGVITGNISYVLSQMNPNEELYEVLSDVQEGARQAQNLTHQLITFAKGGLPIKKLTNIRHIIEESTKFALRGTKVQYDCQFPNDLWPVDVDSGQMNQVFTNLILNATQAMPDGGTIQIQTENNNINSENSMLLEPGKYIKIVVADQGIGISEKHLPKIFDLYYSTKHKGKGLGLSTTHSIISKHNGQILVESQLGKGTTFCIYLPAVADTIDQVKETEKQEYVSHKGQGKILIMDDQEFILKVLDRMLKSMGYETVLSTDGAQAIELYREAYQSQKPFDAVILDLTVPGAMGGTKTISELLKINPKVKAIVSSGYSNDPIMANYDDYGFSGVVPKPFTKNQLAEVLNKIFDKNG